MKLFETRKGNIYTKIISEYLFCLRDKFLVLRYETLYLGHF